MHTRSMLLKDLQVHPAQMRTTLEIGPMVELTQQVLARGIDPHQPIVATPDGYVVSGHRRWLALLLAHEVRASAGSPEPERSDVERVVAEVARSAGDLAHAYRGLTERHGQHPVEVAVFEGDLAGQILALQAANFGQVQADAMGLAHSFTQAVACGLSPARIAANIGKSPAFVEAHLALAQLPAELAQLIVAGRLPLGVAAPLAGLPEVRREALARVVAVRAQTSTVPGVAQVKEAAARLKAFQGFGLPLTDDPVERNRARALSGLWETVLRTAPNRAWVVAADAAYQDVLDDPAGHPEHAAALVYALDRNQVAGGKVDWPALLQAYVPGIGCGSCIVHRLPPERLRDELVLPCRHNGDRPQVCIAWIGERDPFALDVPWSWQGLPGVSATAPYRVAGQDDLLRAWEARRRVEQEEGGQPAALAAQAAEPAAPGAVPAEGHDRARASGAGASEEEGPIRKMRETIRRYMAHHTELPGVTHPLAARCAACRHRLEASPTKDPAVPPCAWAARLHTVEFLVREPAEGSGPRIPWCRQYAPAETDWSRLADGQAGPPGPPRPWIIHQIKYLAGEKRNTRGSGELLEVLTGRPMKSDEAHSSWFADMFEQQVGRLTDQHLWTLYLWALADWQRLNTGSSVHLLPLDRDGQKFALYRVTRLEL